MVQPLWRSQPFARSVVAVVLLATVLFALSAEAVARPSRPTAPQRAVVLQAADALEYQLYRELNVVRRQAGLRPLRWSRALERAASHHSAAMGLRGFFSHHSANGASFRQRVERFYRRPPSWRFYVVGENLMRGRVSLRASTVLRRWLASPGHRRNVYGRWRDVGFGVVRVQNAPGVFGGRPVAIVTADFGTRG